MTTDLLTLAAAVPLAAMGGDAFLRGVLGVSAWLRLPKMLVATTLAAFATSSPELTVSSMAALAGRPGIGLGDALGSNVVNVGLIFGLALLFGPVRARLSDVKRELALALAVPVLTMALVIDGFVSRAEGLLLLILFTVWLHRVALQALAQRRAIAAEPLPRGQPLRAVLLGVAGLACMVLAGRLFVTGASGIATVLGVHPYVIGATVVALGTSLPELMTTLLARWRGHDDVGLGTLLGSNLFNGLAIVGVAATIHPITIPPLEVATALGFGAATVLLTVPRNEVIPRGRGLVLLAVYGSFVVATLTLS